MHSLVLPLCARRLMPKVQGLIKISSEKKKKRYIIEKGINFFKRATNNSLIKPNMVFFIQKLNPAWLYSIPYVSFFKYIEMTDQLCWCINSLLKNTDFYKFPWTCRKTNK